MYHFRLGFQQFLTIDDEETMARCFHTATLKVVGRDVTKGFRPSHTAYARGFFIHHGDISVRINAFEVTERASGFFPLEIFNFGSDNRHFTSCWYDALLGGKNRFSFCIHVAYCDTEIRSSDEGIALIRMTISVPACHSTSYPIPVLSVRALHLPSAICIARSTELSRFFGDNDLLALFEHRHK